MSKEEKKEKPKTTEPTDVSGSFLDPAMQGMDPHYMERWRRNRIRQPYDISPGMSSQYHRMTAQPMTDKQAKQFFGVGLLTAGLERGIMAQEAGSVGAKYAAEELAQARADMKAEGPKVTDEEKYAIRTESMAPVDAEIEESKADVGAYIASKGGTVKDIIAARDIGVQAKADAAVKADYIIAEKELQNWQKGEAMAQAAKARADNMVAVVDKKEMEQLKYTADLVGDVAKVTLTTMAHQAAGEERSAVDQLFDKGVSLDDIRKLQTAARDAGWGPGSRGEHHYMLSHFKGSSSKGGDKPSQVKADTAIKSEPLPRPAIDVSQSAPRPGGLDDQREAEAAVRQAEAPPKLDYWPWPARRQIVGPTSAARAQDAATRLKASQEAAGEREVSLVDEDIEGLGRQLAGLVTSTVIQTPGGRWVNVGEKDPSAGRPFPTRGPPAPMTGAQRQELIRKGLLPSGGGPTTPMSSMEQAEQWLQTMTPAEREQWLQTLTPAERLRWEQVVAILSDGPNQ